MHYSQLQPGDGSANSSDNSPVEQNLDTASRRSITTRSFRTVSVGNPDLKEPLNVSHDDDPFYVFREDLYRKLDLVDEGLAEYLRIVHQTVSMTLNKNYFVVTI
jgi:hypothetical protein